MSSNPTWIVHTDGASRGNPGPAGAGVYIVSPSEDVHEFHEYLQEKTNNQAEYQALLLALEKLILLKANTDPIVLNADSELMIKQLNGIYRVKNANVLPLFQEAKKLITNFKNITFKHVRREFNKDADRLANIAIDEAL